MKSRPQQLAVAAEPRTTSDVATARVGAETVFLIWSPSGLSLFGRRRGVIGRYVLCRITTEYDFRQVELLCQRFARNIILANCMRHDPALRAILDEFSF